MCSSARLLEEAAGAGSATVSVTVTDSAGASANATISYASPAQVNIRLPTGLASGGATVPITAGETKVTTKINAQPVCPHLFLLNRAGLAAATRVRNGVTSTEEVYATASSAVVARPIALRST